MPDKITKVQEGDVILIDGAEFTIKPSCGNVGPRSGAWRCVTHGIGFGNQLQKDLHSGNDRPHKLAWICVEHGPEVP